MAELGLFVFMALAAAPVLILAVVLLPLIALDLLLLPFTITLAVFRVLWNEAPRHRQDALVGIVWFRQKLVRLLYGLGW